MKKFIRSITILLVLTALPAGLLFATGYVQNITFSPSSPETDNDVTVTFQVQSSSSSCEIKFALGLSKISTSSADNACRINWLANEDGIYRGDYTGDTYYWVNGVSQSATTMNITDVGGVYSGGLSAGTATAGTWKTVNIITHIPPEQAGTGYYFNVVVEDCSRSLRHECCGTNQYGEFESTSSFNIVGLPFLKTNLQTCNYNSDVNCTGNDDDIYMGVKIQNWGESGFNLNGFSVRYCFYDTATTYNTQDSTNFQAHWPNGTNYCNVFNPQAEADNIEITAVDCGDNRTANYCWEIKYKDSPQTPFFIPPNGGDFTTASQYSWFEQSGNKCLTPSDDYARVTEMTNCTTYDEYQYVPLYWNGVMMCEWISTTTTDSETGREYCDNTECADYIRISKSVDLGPGESRTPRAAMIGDTITYCVTFTNSTDELVLTFDLWDSIPAITSFVDCDTTGNTYVSSSGCQTAEIGGRTIVYWRSELIPPGGVGTVCFRVTVDSYPSIMEKHSIFAVLRKYFDYS